MEAIIEKKDSKYLVKWENSPQEENTWEPRSAIPLDIIKKYERDLLVKGEKGKLTEIKKDHTEYRSKDKHRQMPLEENIPELKTIKKSISKAQTENNVKVKPVKSTKSDNFHKKDGDKSNKSIPEQGDLYTIESLVKKKGSKYLVKWENYSDDQNTWEPISSIPKDIIEKFEESMKRKQKSSTQENNQGGIDKQAQPYSKRVKSNSDKACVKEDDAKIKENKENAFDNTSFKTKQTVEKDNKQVNKDDVYNIESLSR